MSLGPLVEEFLLERGALAVGFATTETLAGGPPSAGIACRMEGALSGKRSTWSPGRYRVPTPEKRDELMAEFLRAVGLYNRRPPCRAASCARR